MIVMRRDAGWTSELATSAGSPGESSAMKGDILGPSRSRAPRAVMPVTEHWHRRRAFGRPNLSRLPPSYFGVMAYL